MVQIFSEDGVIGDLPDCYVFHDLWIFDFIQYHGILLVFCFLVSIDFLFCLSFRDYELMDLSLID